MNERIKVGDTVVYVGLDSAQLAINNGDLGMVVRGVSKWAENSLSVHFRKWDTHKGGPRLPDGTFTHNVGGVEAFYIGLDQLKKHVSYCMFAKEVMPYDE